MDDLVLNPHRAGLLEEAMLVDAGELSVRIRKLWEDVGLIRAGELSRGEAYSQARASAMEGLVPLIVAREKQWARDRRARMVAGARVDLSSEANEVGRYQRCVFVVCHRSGDSAGPVWGHGQRSVLRGLYTLDEDCSCAASKHTEKEISDYDLDCRPGALD